MTDLRKAAEMALKVLCVGANEVLPYDHDKSVEQSIQTLRQALAQPEQEPVAWMYVNTDGECEQIEYGVPFDDPSVIPLYTAPPKREWVGLTDEEIEEYKWMGQDVIAVIKEVQETLKEKNT